MFSSESQFQIVGVMAGCRKRDASAEYPASYYVHVAQTGQTWELESTQAAFEQAAGMEQGTPVSVTGQMEPESVAKMAKTGRGYVGQVPVVMAMSVKRREVGTAKPA